MSSSNQEFSLSWAFHLANGGGDIDLGEPEGESGWQASGYGQFEEWEDARYHAENIRKLKPKIPQTV